MFKDLVELNLLSPSIDIVTFDLLQRDFKHLCMQQIYTHTLKWFDGPR